MKRVIVILLSLALIMLTGCNNTVAASNFLSTMPWSPTGVLTNDGEEVCEYKVIRYLGDAKDGTVITKDNSALIYTLREGYSFNLNSTGVEIIKDPVSALLTVELSVSYVNTDEVNELYRDQTDVITAYSAFNRFTLNPTRTYRNAFTIEAPHTLYIDYTQGKATLTDSLGENSLNIKSGGYDNESLYYLLRALNTIAPGGSATLPLILAYDDFKYGNKSIKSKEIIQSTAADLVDVEVEPSIYQQFNDDATTDYKLSCYQTAVRLNTAKSGPATKLYYATQKTSIASTNIHSVSYKATNVLVKIEYPLYGYLSGSLGLDYTQVYQLVKYSNR